MFFDSHCHLDEPRLRPLLPALLADAESAGVSAFVVPGVHPDNWHGILSLSRSYPRILPAFGVHPKYADMVTPQLLSELRQLATVAVAVGEIGLDYLLSNPCRDTQKEAFRAQLSVAVESGLPVLIHCRKAFADLLQILDQQGVKAVGGVMHAFSGSPETASHCLQLGLHISLAGPVTYPNAVRPVAVAAAIPIDRLLLETDAPDLAPEPYRGQVNLPQYLKATADRVAAIRGLTVEELARITSANAARLFKLEQTL